MRPFEFAGNQALDALKNTWGAVRSGAVDLGHTVAQGARELPMNAMAGFMGTPSAVPGTPRDRALAISRSAGGITTTPTPPVINIANQPLSQISNSLTGSVTGAPADLRALQGNMAIRAAGTLAPGAGVQPNGLLAGQVPSDPTVMSDEGKRLMSRAQENMTARKGEMAGEAGSAARSDWVNKNMSTASAPGTWNSNMEKYGTGFPEFNARGMLKTSQ